MTPALHPDRGLAALDRTALIAVLLTSALLLHAHGIAEMAIAVADFCFLARSALTRDWAWTKTPWLLIGGAWWVWIVLCSLPIPALDLGQGGRSSLLQALALGRFLLWLAAMEHAILRPAHARRWLHWAVAASAAYIAIHASVQFITGYNLYGEPAGEDGVLSGPFGKPRAGPPFARILLPAIIPWAAAILTQAGILPMIRAGLVLVGGIAIALLIGQRMPLVLTGLGLLTVGVLLPRLRWGVGLSCVAAVALLLATPIVAPKAYQRLVLKFSDQLTHFSASHYGELYARAVEIGVQNPLTGLGAEGYRTGCPQPRYFQPSFDGSVPDGGGAKICWNHPHNYYLEALTTGGFPGLILFSALALAWLSALGRGLWRTPDPLRAALFAAAVIQLWPIASTTGFTAMPVGGWSFLLLGWGLAEARWPNPDGRVTGKRICRETGLPPSGRMRVVRRPDRIGGSRYERLTRSETSPECGR